MDADLITLIEKRRRVPEDEARSIFRRILEIVSFMHSNNISHRDLKPDNFLINFCPLGNCVVSVKLTDFELSAELTDKKEFTMFCGSHAYAGTTSYIYFLFKFNLFPLILLFYYYFTYFNLFQRRRFA